MNTPISRIARRWLVGALASIPLATPLPAAALKLGEVQGRAAIGKPLHLTVPLYETNGKPPPAQCRRLIAEGDESDTRTLQLRIDGNTLHITGARPVSQPVLQFRLKLGCADADERSYVVLAEPPAHDSTAANGPASSPPPTTPPAPPALVVPRPTATRAATPPKPAAANGLTIPSPTTLRQMSRQRYPDSAPQRLAFIRRMIAANPKIFVKGNNAGEFDRALKPGVKLTLPADLPESNKFVATKSAPAAGKPPAHPTAQSAKRSHDDDKPAAKTAKVVKDNAAPRNKLVISASTPTLAVGDNMGAPSPGGDAMTDRLMDAMNEQIKAQISLTNRLASAENEVGEIKRQAALERAAFLQMQNEVQVLREQAENDNIVKLSLAIMLVGGLGAWGLRRFVARHRSGRGGGASAFDA